MNKPAAWLAGLFGVVLGAGAVGAQAPEAVDTIELEEAAERVPPSRPALEEIVVTAQKRAASLQDTPISIVAMGARDLELRGIEGVESLGEAVPGLTLEVFPTHQASLRVFIRGVGVYDAQLTQDPAVGVYLDGVYMARSLGLALDVADLERIEVLRGPQGTLYGRNTTGGAINLITRRPDAGQFTMDHRLRLGHRGELLAHSRVNWPLGERAALKLALFGHGSEGHVRNSSRGGNFGDRKERALRADLRWTPRSGLLVDYAFDWTDLAYYNYLHQATQLPLSDKGTGEFIKPAAVARTAYGTGRLDTLASGPPLVESGSLIRGHTLTVAQPLAWGGGDYELKYIGAHRSLVDREYADLGGGAGSLEYRLDSHVYDGPAADAAQGGPTPLVVPTVTHAQWSHELQFSGRLPDHGLRFVAGLFAFEEEGVEDRHRLNHQFSAPLAPEQINQFGLGDALGQFNNARLVQFVNFWWSINNRSLAAYSELTWTPPIAGEKLDLTVGYRHSRDRRAARKFRITDTYFELLQADGSGTAELFTSAEMFDYVPAGRSFADGSGSFIAEYRVSEPLRIYAKAVEGYKSGGFNVRDPHINGESEAADSDIYGFGFTEGFDAETLRSYELGIKSEWLDRRLRVNADVFHSDYEDMQINFLLPATIADTKTRNAGSARLRGLEVELSLALAEGWRLRAD